MSAAPRPDLEAIRARCEAAEPGPWWIEPHWVGEDWPKRVLAQDPNRSYRRTIICDDFGYAAERDHIFIASARTDIPALLDYVEHLERKVADAHADCPSCSCPICVAVRAREA